MPISHFYTFIESKFNKKVYMLYKMSNGGYVNDMFISLKNLKVGEVKS